MDNLDLRDIKVDGSDINILRKDPYWRAFMPDRPGKKSLCPKCGFPSVSMRDKKPYIDKVLCPWCGYPENQGGMDNLVIS